MKARAHADAVGQTHSDTHPSNVARAAEAAASLAKAVADEPGATEAAHAEADRLQAIAVKARARADADIQSKAAKRTIWSTQEDAELSALVHELGEGQWAKIAQRMPPQRACRIACRKRWVNNLSPQAMAKKLGGIWTEDEDNTIILGHIAGLSAPDIAHDLPGRTAGCVNNRWWSAALRESREALKRTREECAEEHAPKKRATKKGARQ